MTLQAVIVIIVLIFLILSLYKEWLGPALTFVIAVSILGLTRILSPKEILHGFANESLAVIVMLIIIGDLFRKVSTLDGFFDRIFKNATTVRGFVTRMMLMVLPISAFIYNTPTVAVMMPIVHNNAKKYNYPISKLLIPLSFAAILGGNITSIGASTNMLVNGLLAEQTIIPNTPLLGFFDFTAVGLTMAILGTLYVAFYGIKKLPAHENILDAAKELHRKYTVEARLKEGSHLIGKTIFEAGFKNLKGLQLVEVLRENMRVTAVPQDMILMEEDILLFTGNTNSINDFVKQHDGLDLPSLGMFSRKEDQKLVEIVITYNSPLIGKTLREIKFRASYDASVIAIFRNGEAISTPFNDLPLKSGDALLILTGSYFEQRTADVSDFYNVSDSSKIDGIKQKKSTFLYVGFLLVVITAVFGWIQFFNGLLILMSLLVLFKVINPKTIVKSIDFQLVLIIALSLSLGTAMAKTGVSQLFANGMINFFKPYGNTALIAAIFLITTLLAAIVSVRAAVAIVLPVVMSIALSMHFDPKVLVLSMAFGATANFMTPIGYQTNMMVYGPGNYKFKDYLRIGIPLTILYFIVSTLVLSWIYF